METGGIRGRFERYADLLEDIRLRQVRLYARRQSASAPSAPSWDSLPGGSGVPGDRVGNAASAAVDMEREIERLRDDARNRRQELERAMEPLCAREKNVLRARYFDGGGRVLTWQEVADIVFLSEKGAQGVASRAFEKMERMGLYENHTGEM